MYRFISYCQLDGKCEKSTDESKLTNVKKILIEKIFSRVRFYYKNDIRVYNLIKVIYICVLIVFQKRFEHVKLFIFKFRRKYIFR